LGLPLFGEEEAGAIYRREPPVVPYVSNGPTNEVGKVVNGMKRRRLGGSDIFVSELG